LKPLIRKHLGNRRKKPLLLVLPTPLLPHRILPHAQRSKGINIDLVKLLQRSFPLDIKGAETPRVRYSGDYELYPNHPLQRDELVAFLHYLVEPSALIILSGDVHCGSVVNGLYVHGKNADAIRTGKGDWGMRIAQVTSSPIKNQLPRNARSLVDVLENGAPAGVKIGTSVLPFPVKYVVDNPAVLAPLVYQKLKVPNRFVRTRQDTTLGLRVAEKELNGDLGLMKTFIYEPHLCVVDIPSSADGRMGITFIGVHAKTGKEALATTTLSLANSPTLFTEPASTFESS
jgi:hypothetical protein